MVADGHRRHDGGVIEHHEEPQLPDHPTQRRRGRRRRRRSRPLDLPLLLASLVIAVGLLLIVWGVSVSVTSDDEELPDAILAVTPGDGDSQVSTRANIRIDLEQGHQGRLFIDDTEIPVVNANEVRNQQGVEPGEQITMPPVAIYEPGSATISFTPTDEAATEEFARGTRQASLIYWETTEGEDTARTYNWEFEVVL